MIKLITFGISLEVLKFTLICFVFDSICDSIGSSSFSQLASVKSKIVKQVNSHVNLIPINPVDERDFIQADKKSIEMFKNILEKNKVNATIRREMGRDINGACGQLRRNYNKVNK